MKQTNVKDYIEKDGDRGRLSLPIMKVPRVESIAYALRLTSLDKYNIDHIITFLKEFDDYIIIREESKTKKEHYHAVLFTTLFEDDIRDKVRCFLKQFFTGPPKRGDANKQYNLSQVEDLELSIIYILKDSQDIFCSDNIDRNVVLQLSKKAYKKYSKEDFAKQLEELKSKFKENNTSLNDMMVAVCQLKAIYRQPINMNYIYQLCLSCKFHNDPSVVGEYVQKFLSRLE